MAKANNESIKLDKNNVKRKGVHSKSSTSKLKSSKNYKKQYKAQGR